MGYPKFFSLVSYTEKISLMYPPPITLRTNQKKNIYGLFIDFSHASLLFNVITINSELRKYSNNSLKYPLFSLELFLCFANLGIKQNLMKVNFKLEFLLFYFSICRSICGLTWELDVFNRLFLFLQHYVNALLQILIF